MSPSVARRSIGAHALTRLGSLAADALGWVSIVLLMALGLGL